MNRMINEDGLIKKLKEKSVVDEVNILSTTYTYKELVYIISNQPTTYDVEKVVKEIDEYLIKIVGRNSLLYKTIMDIVIKGGV